MLERSLHRCSSALALALLLLITVSGLMVSQSTGLAVPEWARVGQPLHRIVAGLVAVGALSVLLLSHRSSASRPVKALAWLALAMVVAQAVLGMALASAGPIPLVGVLQASLAHLLFAAAALLVVMTAADWAQLPRMVEDELRPSLRSIAWAPPLLVVVQILLGSAYRHGIMGVIPHLAGAFLIAGALTFLGMLVATTYPKHRVLKGAALLLVWLMLGQIVLGLVALTYRANPAGMDWNPNLVWFTVAHILVGSLTLAVSFVLAVQIRRHVREAAEAPAASLTRRLPSGEPEAKTS